MQALLAFPQRIRVETQVGSFLPRNRDILTKLFLDSAATHMLCVDSDIGWTAQQAQALLDTGKDFVSGVYCCKTPSKEIPAQFTEARDGNLIGCVYVPAGFMLLSRACVERMVGAYRDLQYKTQQAGHLWALWSPMFEPGFSYSGEDVAFCRRWTRIGGDIWMHPEVVVRHYGETAFVPDDKSVAREPSQ